MEDRRATLALFISILIVFVYSETVLTPYTKRYETQHVSSAAAPAATVAATVPSVIPTGAAASSSPVAPTAAELAASARYSIESADVRFALTALGGRFAAVELKHYRETVGSEKFLNLVSSSDTAPLPLGLYLDGGDDARVLYAVEAVTPSSARHGDQFTVPTDGALTISLRGVLPSGRAVQKDLTFDGRQAYVVSVKAQLGAPPQDGARMALEWVHVEPVLNGAAHDFHGFSTLGSNGKVTKLVAGQVPEQAQDLGESRWVSYGSQYFFSAALPSEQSVRGFLGRHGSAMFYRVLGDLTQGQFQLYIGPRDYDMLKGVGHELYRSIDLGWFSFLAFPLLWLLQWFYVVLGNHGLAIILLTLIIKIAFLPLTQASMKSMKAMSELQPEVQALRARIKDPTQLNQEMMALYKRKGVNPMGGCFPVLIQIPVFLGLYNALLNSIELRHAPFALWINDLSGPEGLPVLGFHVPVMVILMGISMFIQQLKAPSTLDPAQQKVMLIMPVVFTFLFVGFPAGLTLYWLVNNVISIVQQSFLRKEKRATPLQATLGASIGIFAFAFILTRL